MNIGPLNFDTPVIAAPMAGVTDKPFRNLCYQLGASYSVSEMITSDTKLWNSKKTRYRLDHSGQSGPIAVQIAGTSPVQMAEAAKLNADLGAEIIDINMGCPAKKVCKVAAGSALLKHEKLVADILEATVNSVSVPVTLKIRTGWDHDSKNAVNIASIAEQSGIQAIAIHGRTRNDFFNGEAEYETIRHVKESTSIPVIANGDIETPEKAKQVLAATKADAVMIGRAAQGRPWIFREITHYLKYGTLLQPLTPDEICDILVKHLLALYEFYGEEHGVRIARKHVGWYLKSYDFSGEVRHRFNTLPDSKSQTDAIMKVFSTHFPLTDQKPEREAA